MNENLRKSIRYAPDGVRQAAEKELATLEAHVKALENMLSDYGQHLQGCNASYGGNRKCTCGWDRTREILKEKP